MAAAPLSNAPVMMRSPVMVEVTLNWPLQQELTGLAATLVITNTVNFDNLFTYKI